MKRKFNIVVATVSMVASQLVFAGSATWNADPTSKDWNTAANWTPQSVPMERTDVATFDVSSVTNVLLSGAATIDSIVFTASARAFTINVGKDLTFVGAGVVNDSSAVQTLVGTSRSIIAFKRTSSAGHTMIDSIGPIFSDSATAGNSTLITRGFATFIGSATAGQATIMSTPNGLGSLGTYFMETSSAGTSNILCDGANIAGSSVVGSVTFYQDSSADHSIVNCFGGSAEGGYGARAFFTGNSTAAEAVLIATGGTNGGLGGTLLFWDDSTGAEARVELFDTGILNVLNHNPPGITVGSIEGDGTVVLGKNNLTVGSNDLATVFSGDIRDGTTRAGGSLTMTGAGTLTLTGPSSYTGGTIIEGLGTLFVNNRLGSGSGTGAVQANSGSLGGGGIIAGAVTIGTGAGGGATLAPGQSKRKQGVLNIQNTLTLNADATYAWKIDSNKADGAKVIVSGAVIISAANFSPVELRSGSIAMGKVFTIIDNTSASPINGTFANLPDGGTVTIGLNDFQANYEGGDGNDLTLAVVP